jgi:hypothetical protein
MRKQPNGFWTAVLVLSTLLSGCIVAAPAPAPAPVPAPPPPRPREAPAPYVEREIIVDIEPPPPLREPIPRLRRGWVWVPGHWEWHRGLRRYEWVPGEVQRDRRGYRYAPGHWERRPGGWIWLPGEWR